MAPADLRTLLRQTETALERSRSDANALRLDLSQLRDTGAELAQEYARLSHGCRQTERRTELAADALNAIENRLDLLEAVRDLSNSADDRLASLNQLAKEVMGRAADFQAQKESLDRSLVEVKLVTDLLAAWEARATKLTEGNEPLAHAAEAVVRLEQRAAEVTADLERRGHDFEVQTHTIEHALDEAARVTDVVSALDRRVATLTGPDHGLAHAEEAVVHLERRVAQATADLERRVNDFDAQTHTIEHALAEATRATNILSALDRRVATLTGSDGLAHAEEAVVHLERRVAETTAHLERRVAEVTADLERRAAEVTADLERRVHDFEAQAHTTIEHALDEATRVTNTLSALDTRVATLTGPGHGLAHAEEAVVHLEQRAAEVTADLERRGHDFEVQTHTIEHALDEAARFTDVVSALDRRVATLTGRDHGLAHAEEAVVHLERRVAETTAHLERRVAELTADLERRVNDFEARTHTIERALDDARVTDVVSALDAQVATLTGPDHGLAHAEEAVVHLERRAAEPTAHLEQVASAEGVLEHELANSREQPQPLTEWARNPVSASQGVPLPKTFAAISDRAQKGQPVQRRVAGLAALTLYLALLGLIVTGSGNQPVQIAGAAHAVVRERPLSASASMLPSRTLGITTFSVPMNLPGRTVVTVPSNDAASDARSRQRQRDRRGERTARGPDGRPSGELVRPPAALDASAVRSGSVPATTGTTGPSRNTGPARDTGPRFTGALEIVSVPTGAAVFINQQHVGETPVHLTRFRAGSHAVRIEHAGYERWTAAVFVPADKQTRVSAELKSRPDR